MGRRRRGYLNIQSFYEQSTAQASQDRLLDDHDDEEERVRARTLWLGNIMRNATELDILSQLSALYTGVQSVHLLCKDTSTPSQAQSQQPDGSGPQRRITAKVQFADPIYASAVLAKKQSITRYCARDKVHKQEDLLPAGKIGYLKRCSCRRLRVPCQCPGYVRADWYRPQRTKFYQDGSAGDHTLQATDLQIGSFGADGMTLRPELEVTAAVSVRVNLRERCLVLGVPLPTADSPRHFLVHRFRHLRLTIDRQRKTMSFTVKQPPKVLTYHKCSSCHGELDAFGHGPLYALCGDPTAPKQYGMVGQQCFNCSIINLQSAAVADGSTSDHEGDEVEMTKQIASALASLFGLTAKAGDSSRVADPDVEDSGDVLLTDMADDLDLALTVDEDIQASTDVVGEGVAGADGVLGRCLTYELRLDEEAITELYSDGNKLLKKLKSFRILRSAHQETQQQHNDEGVLAEDTNTMLAGPLQLQDMLHPTDLEGILYSLPFYVSYHVLVLLSSGFASPWQVCTPSFQQALQDAQLENADMACRALAEISAYSIPTKNLAADFSKQLLEIRAEEQKYGPKTQLSRTLCKVLRVHVTPTRVKFLLPEVETGNRVVRHFCAPEAGSRTFPDRLSCLDQLQFETSHFLRVSFGDEQGDKVLSHGDNDESMEAFFQRMAHVLRTGVKVGGRLFSFLANSSSQLRAWSTWMVSDPQQGASSAAGADAIADALRHWLGDAMETEKVPAKCAARLGQGFSATVDAAEVTDRQMSLVRDVNQGKYCFSDGVGRISSKLLDTVLEAVPFAGIARPQISAIQIRFRGCKGVLSKYTPLQGRQLEYRPSMEKFGSNHPQLEVCSVATWLPAYLNRQVIIMMEYNGVSAETLCGKLKAQLNRLAEMCASTGAALTVLPTLGGIITGAQESLMRMLDVSKKCGLPLDELSDACLKAVARWQVTDLRQKARLLVHEGATLVGVMNEFNVLEEDEVFVQIQLPDRGVGTVGAPTCIISEVMLAKHPVAHRGDVRRVTAVDPFSRPGGQLLVENYVNVVVFSQRGDRPLPNKLSGSDLDGDQYMVVWDKDLLQPSNSPPMDYTAQPPETVEHVQVHHLQQHFVDYAKNDNLGKISIWLLAHADAQGADCDLCEELAQLHSTAVDFPKTGRPAVIKNRAQLVPETYPHWMEKKDKTSYPSKKVLGQIYDLVKRHPLAHAMEGEDSERQSEQSTTNDNGNAHGAGCSPQLSAPSSKNSPALVEEADTSSWPESLLHVPGVLPHAKQYLQQASNRFVEFEGDVIGLMHHWRVYDAGEMLTGCLHQLQHQPGQRHQHSEQRQQIHREVSAVFSKARRRFLVDLLQLAGSSGTLQLLEMKSIRDLEFDVNIGLGVQYAGDNTRLQYAAAYMVVANKWAIKQQDRLAQKHLHDVATAAPKGQQHTNVHSPAAKLDEAPEAELSGTDDEESEEEVDAAEAEYDWLSDDDDDDDDDDDGKQYDDKSQEVRRLIRLSFQWVVARELQMLAALT